MSISKVLCCGAAVGLCALGFTAKADVPDVVFEVTAEAAGVSVAVPIYAEWGEYDPATHTWSYELPAGILFFHNGEYLGVLGQFRAEVAEDPEVNLNFSVQAGTIPTTFHIASALLSDFPTIPAAVAEGRASAAMTVTDWDFNGAALQGVGDTGGAYLAQYNGWAGDPFQGPQGTTFAEGIYSIDVDPWEGTDTGELDVDWTPIGEDVEDMSSLISFELSAFDLASGTSHYEIIPEPGALALLALGGLAFWRRRL
jgi:hypothetical protein